MSADNGESTLLPYRMDGPDLTKLVEGKARGRDLEQIKAAGNFSTKSFDGTVSAAQSLGFLDPATADLTDLGRDFALASIDDRRRILIEAMLGFAPYELLFDAIFDRDPTSTPVEWIETWWSTNQFGNSGNNRSEGSSAFAQLVEFVGLGDYVRGRRGHKTRIEWKSIAEEILHRHRSEHAQEPVPPSGPASTPQQPAHRHPALADQRPATARGLTQNGLDYNEIKIVFSPDRVAVLRAPPVLTQAEKARLLGALEYLIAVGEVAAAPISAADDEIAE